MQGNTMNERILKLAKEAGMRSPDLFKLTVSHMSTDTLEKFAELIVQECMCISDSIGEHGYIAAEEMGKHFGVEE